MILYQITIVSYSLFLASCSTSTFRAEGKTQPSDETHVASERGRSKNDLENADVYEQEDVADRFLDGFRVENPSFAQPTNLGTAIIFFRINNLLNSDQDLKVEYSVRTVDFLRPVATLLAKTVHKDTTDLYDQDVRLEIQYKYLPEVALYEQQSISVTLAEASSNRVELDLPFSLKVLRSFDAKDALPTITLIGKEGHPYATP